MMEWNQLIGDKWSKLFCILKLSPDSIVVEIGAGKQPKIGFGLARVGFRGLLFLVDPSDSRETAYIYSKLLPHAVICPVASLFQHSSREDLTQDRVTCVLGNHLIDDLLLTYFSQNESLPADYYHLQNETAAKRTAQHWESVIYPNRKRLFKRLLSELIHWLTVFTPTYFILHEYESHFYLLWSSKWPTLKTIYPTVRLFLKEFILVLRSQLNYQRQPYLSNDWFVFMKP